MNEWKCANCSYSVKAAEPPKKCPSCGKKCEWMNVTCYIPECAAQGVDKRL